MGIFTQRVDFNTLKSREEVFSWFKSDRNWKKLGDKIINALIDSLQKDMVAFEAFIYIAENCKLLKKQFIPICKEGDKSSELVISTFALLCYDTGSAYRDKLIKLMDDPKPVGKERDETMKFALLAYQSAVNLENYMISVYFQLAFLRGKLAGKFSAGARLCEVGLEKISELEKIPLKKLSEAERKLYEKIPVMSTALQDALMELDKTMGFD